MAAGFSRAWIFSLTGSLTLFALVAALCLPRLQRAGPTANCQASLWVDEPDRDLGVALPGETLSLVYRLENRGAADLVVTQLHSSCGCSPATLDKDRVRPGGVALVSVSFRLPLVAGLAKHAVFFSTNDPANPEVSISFRAVAQWPVEATPPNIYAGVLMVGCQVAQPLELSTTDGSPMGAPGIRTSAPWIRVQMTTPQGSHRQSYTVVLSPPPHAGPFTESVEFVTGRRGQPTIVIPVRGEITTGVQISPPRLLLPVARPGDILESRLLLRSIDGAPARVGLVRAKSDQWKVISWRVEKGPSSTGVLRLRLRVPGKAGYARTALMLATAAGAPVQEVPVSCLIADKGTGLQ